MAEHSLLIKPYNLLSTAVKMLMCMGYSQKDAELTAKCLIEADCRHLHSHGVAMLATYLKHIQKGCLKLKAIKPEIIYETPLSTVIDGHSGVGFVIADYAVEQCIKKARKNGISFVTVRNANHYGFAGYWTLRMARAGLIGVTATNTVRSVCPTRSAERSLGTNPISVTFPFTDEHRAFSLDMATSVLAHGKIVRSREFAAQGAIPDEVVIDSKGKAITDFTKVLDIEENGDSKTIKTIPNAGGILPLGGSTEIHGGHKGYGLSLLVELLTAGLSGGVPSKFIPLASEGICFFFMAFAPDLFGDKDTVIEHVAKIVSEYKATVPLNPASPVLIPGEKELMYREKAETNGIELSGEIISQIRAVAKVTGSDKILNEMIEQSIQTD